MSWNIIRKPVLLSTIILLVAGKVCAQDALNPVPQISQPLVPMSAAPGGPDFALRVNGTGFMSGSVVNWNGNPRPTTFVSSTQVSATIPASDIATAGTAWITVINPTPGGGTSNLTFFHVTDPSASVTFGAAGTAAEWTPYNGGRSVTTGDFDTDGVLDLAVVHYTDYTSNILSILLGNGDGTFQAPLSYPVGDGPSYLITGDFNGDGKADLAVPNYNDLTVSVLLGNGDGTFQPYVDYGAGNLPTSLTTTDFNGDGKLDLAVTNGGGGTVSVLLGNDDGTFQPKVDYWINYGWPASLATDDFNIDGKPDLAVADAYFSSISILLGNGDGTFLAAVEYATGSRPTSVMADDFNGDARPDLVTANINCFRGWSCGPSSTFSILLGNGDGTFQTHLDYDSGSPSRAVSAGDFNGDGHTDLVVNKQDDEYVLLVLGNGDGTFQTPVPYFTRDDPLSVTGGDFNGDGRLDIVTVNFGDAYVPTRVSILLQAAAVTLSPATITFPDQPVGATSPVQTLTLTNSGSAMMAISSIEASGDFAATHTCTLAPDKLEAGAGCTIEVTFTPTAAGARSGALTVTSDAVGSPNTFALSATGTDFALGMQSGGSTSASVNAGQTATYNLQIEPSGFSGDVALSCDFQGTQPRGASCSVAPSMVTLNGTDPAPFTVSVSTTARALAAPNPFFHRVPLGPRVWHSAPLPSAWVIVLALLLGIALLAAAGTCPGALGRPARGNSRLEPLATPLSGTLSARVVLAGTLLAALVWGSCGGESAPPPLQDQGTPAGNYTVILSATANGVSKTTNLGLQVN